MPYFISLHLQAHSHISNVDDIVQGTWGLGKLGMQLASIILHALFADTYTYTYVKL